MIEHILFRLFLYILFLSCSPYLSAEISDDGKAYEYFLDGEYDLFQNNYHQAEINYFKALSINSSSRTILQSLIDINIFQGDYVDAIQYMEKIIELSPNDKIQGLELFQLYIHEGELDKAPKLLDTLLTYNPDDIDLLYAKANIQYSKNDWENLLRTYHLIYLSNTENSDILMNIYEIGTATGQETLSLALLNDINTQNESPQLLEFLIDLHSRLHEYSEAINNIKKLINIDNNSEERTIQLGVLYLFNKQFDAVITTLEPLYQNGNYSLKVLRPLLIAYSTVNKTEYQIKISQKLIKEFPELSFGYEALSLSFLNVGDEVNAVQILHKAINKFPNEIIFPQTLASIYYQSKNFKLAEKYYKIALIINPQILLIKHDLAMMFEEMGATGRADSLFKNIIQQNKNNGMGLNDYAYIISERNHISINELKYALELAEQAMSIDPKNAAYLDTIGWIHYKMGTYEEAHKYLEKSITIDQNNPVILEHMGDIYHQLGISAKALIHYKKALEQDSNNIIIQDKIDKLHGK